MRLSPMDHASVAQDMLRSGSSMASYKEKGAEASRQSSRRLAELYGHDGIDEQEEQAHGENSQGSIDSSAWKEIKEDDSIMMVVQEGSSDKASSLMRSRRGRMLAERNHHERRNKDDSKENDTACAWEQRQKLKEHLHDVVLIMNFNWGWIARKSLAFWKRVYGPMFDNIVFVSKDIIPEIGLEGEHRLTAQDGTSFMRFPGTSEPRRRGLG